jgi:hypothetical protein
MRTKGRTKGGTERHTKTNKHIFQLLFTKASKKEMSYRQLHCTKQEEGKQTGFLKRVRSTNQFTKFPKAFLAIYEVYLKPAYKWYFSETQNI